MKIFCNLFLMAGVAIAIHYTNARYLLVEVTDEKEVEPVIDSKIVERPKQDIQEKQENCAKHFEWCGGIWYPNLSDEPRPSVTPSCCNGLKCYEVYGVGRCHPAEVPCKDDKTCNNPGAVVYNATFKQYLVVEQPLLELFPNGCKELPKNHGIYAALGGNSLKTIRCPKSCGCKKCNHYNHCIDDFVESSIDP